MFFYYYFGDFAFIQIGEQRLTENEQEGETGKDEEITSGQIYG